jgi:hypothetical protein
MNGPPALKAVAWDTVGRIAPRRLGEARLRLHHAVQLVAAVGRSLVPAREDDGHTSLEWRPGLPGFVGQEVPGPRPWRAALLPGDFAIAMLEGDGEAGRLALAGRTRDTAFGWVVGQARALGSPADQLRLAAPYSLAYHAIGRGAEFETAEDGSFAELGRWFGNASALLRVVADGWVGAAPVRVWPHHFDVGSVLPLGPAKGESTPSLGIGLSPGDEATVEPYFYVTPWPVPESLPELPAGGHWHREGWTGAMLTASDVVAAGDAAAQGAAASAFLAGTVAMLRSQHGSGAA